MKTLAWVGSKLILNAEGQVTTWGGEGGREGGEERERERLTTTKETGSSSEVDGDTG